MDDCGNLGWCNDPAFEHSLPPAGCNIARRPYTELLELLPAAGVSSLPDEPTLYEQATTEWAAARRWSRAAFLKDPRYGNITVTVGTSAALAAQQRDEALAGGQDLAERNSTSRLATAVAALSVNGRHHSTRSCSSPQYVFSAVPAASTLRGDAEPDLPATLRGSAWRKASLALGGAGSGMSWHVHDAAFAALLAGRKRWLLFDPAALQDGMAARGGERGVKAPNDSGIALRKLASRDGHLEVVNSSTYRQDAAFRAAWARFGWECVQREGELMCACTHARARMIPLRQEVSITCSLTLTLSHLLAQTYRRTLHMRSSTWERRWRTLVSAVHRQHSLLALPPAHIAARPSRKRQLENRECRANRQYR